MVRFTVEVEDEATDEVVSGTYERAIFRDLVVSGAGGEDHRLLDGASGAQ